jgi:DNA-binding beta-propeller fold protein YncE
MTSGLQAALLVAMASGMSVVPQATLDLHNWSAEISDPIAFSYDEFRDRFLVVDGGSRQIVVFERSGAARGVLRFNPTISRPLDVTVSGKGTLYVVGEDSDQMAILADYASGEASETRYVSLTPQNEDHPTARVQPAGIDCDDDGHLYVVDSSIRRTLIYDAEGNYLRSWKGPGTPGAISIAGGEAFVADDRRGGVQIVNLDGRARQRLGVRPEQHPRPIYVNAMAIDRRHRIWVVEDSGALIVLDTTDSVLLSLPPEAFTRAVDISVDSRDGVFVLDRGARSILVFDASRTARARGYGGLR